ncbi:MAG: hypothetical protein JWM12_649 [Ilumatobacteraceae bacterium]|nr:hypothetical protein [Ilumatobacteraceae bacterium]
MTDISALAHVACGAAAVGAGIVNAVAGGGTLISFPVMTAVGVPTVRANATNTVSLCPGYIGGTYAQRTDLTGLQQRLRPQLVAAALGGLGGSVLLIVTSETVFRQIVPFLILAAAILLATQNKIRAWLNRRAGGHEAHHVLEVAAVAVAAVYGGYFGAGLGIMLMAVLGLFSELPFTRLNAVKQLLSFVVNVFAAGFLVFSGKVEWSLVLVMAPCSLLGGQIGGRVAGSLPPEKLRAAVIVFAFAVAIVYLVR